MTDQLELSETILLQKLREGDRSAFDELFRTHYKYLVVIAHKYLHDTDEARDMAQDVFMDLWNRREKVNIQDSLKFFLRRAVINRCLATRRKSSRMTIDSERISKDTQTSDNTTNQVAYNDLNRHIKGIIAALPERCRAIFILSRQEQLSHKEIAAKLDISTKTIENQMTKALKIMRLELKAKGFITLLTIILIQT